MTQGGTAYASFSGVRLGPASRLTFETDYAEVYSEAGLRVATVHL